MEIFRAEKHLLYSRFPFSNENTKCLCVYLCAGYSLANALGLSYGIGKQNDCFRELGLSVKLCVPNECKICERQFQGKHNTTEEKKTNTE